MLYANERMEPHQRARQERDLALLQSELRRRANVAAAACRDTWNSFLATPGPLLPAREEPDPRMRS